MFETRPMLPVALPNSISTAATTVSPAESARANTTDPNTWNPLPALTIRDQPSFRVEPGLPPGGLISTHASVKTPLVDTVIAMLNAMRYMPDTGQTGALEGV